MKTALVTGGSRGIGLASALELGRAGYAVAIMATKAEDAYPQSAARLREAGIAYSWHAGSIADSADRLRVVDEVMARHGRIDVLVNNAGVAPKERNDLLQMTEASFDYVVGTNTKGNMFMTQAVARKMVETKTPGVIVNISSCSAEVSSVNRGEYCVSKAGLSMMTSLFAVRLAEYGIPVYEIRPGIIRTDMTAKVSEKYDKLISEGITPIRRWGTPADIAQAVYMLSQGLLPFSTGEVINVDGGFHLQRL